MEIVKFIGVIIGVWYFVEGSEPIQFIKEQLSIAEGSEPKNTWLKVLRALFNCCLCSGFWIGLAYYQSIELACIVGVSSEVFSRIWNRFTASV